MIDKLESFTSQAISAPCLLPPGKCLLPPSPGEHLKPSLPAQKNESYQLISAENENSAPNVAYGSLPERKLTKSVVSVRRTMDWKARVPSLGSISAETVRRKRRSQYNYDTHPDFELDTVDSHYFIQSSFLQLSGGRGSARAGDAGPR